MSYVHNGKYSDVVAFCSVALARAPACGLTDGGPPANGNYVWTKARSADDVLLGPPVSALRLLRNGAPSLLRDARDTAKCRALLSEKQFPSVHPYRSATEGLTRAARRAGT